MLNYDDIAIVVAIAEKGSFIAASKRLGIPPSTISRRVSEFENRLKVRLFERNTRSIKLTTKGAELIKSCTDHIQALHEAVHVLTTDTDSMSGTLRVSVPLTLGNDLMNRCFADFIRQFPSIKLELDLSNECAELFTQDIDIAIRVGPLKDSDMIAQKLFSTEMILCASPAFIQRQEIQTKNIRSIENKPFLHYLNATTRMSVYDNNTQQSHTLNVIEKFSSNNTLILKNACLQGLGLTCLPKISVQHELETAELIQLFDNYHFFDAKTIYAVYPSKRHLPDYSKAFITHIRQTMI